MKESSQNWESSHSHTDFVAALSNDAAFVGPKNQKIVIEQIEMGELFLPTGQIVVADPANLEDGLPFAGQVPPGRYPVTGCIAKIPNEDSTDDRMACAIIRFSSAVPANWKMAVTAKQRLSELEPGSFFGFGVDSGRGCFVDAQTADRIRRDHDLYERVRDLLNNKRFTEKLTTDLVTNENVIAFSTGFGDGFYPCYWGVSAKGELCCLAADFRILGDSVDQTVTLSLPQILQGKVDSTPLKNAGFQIRADFNWNALKASAARLLPPKQLDVKLPGTVSERVNEIRGIGASSTEQLYVCVYLNRDAELKATNAGKSYTPILSSCVEKSWTHCFKFDQPLEQDATLSLTYVTEWRPFPLFRSGSTP